MLPGTKAHPTPLQHNYQIAKKEQLLPQTTTDLLVLGEAEIPAGHKRRADVSAEDRDTECRWQRVTNHRRDIKPHALRLKLIELLGIRKKFKGERRSDLSHICLLQSHSTWSNIALLLPNWMVAAASGTALEKTLTCFVLLGHSGERLQHRCGDKAKTPLQALLAFNDLLGHGPNTAMSHEPTPVLNI